MIIKKIELINYKSYNGTNSIEFTEGLNVISGMIGTGKTNLFDAFEWILKHSSINQTANKDIGIVNKKSASEADADTHIEASVSLDIAHEKKIYTFKKSLKCKKVENEELSQPRIDLSLSYKDVKTQNFEYTDNQNDFIEKLNEIVPPTLLNYILFRGENVKELINFEDKDTLAVAVDRVSYYPHYLKLQNLVIDFEKKASQKFSEKLRLNRRNKSEIEKNEDEIKRLERDITNIKIEIEELDKDIEAKKEAEMKLESDLKSINGIPEKIADIAKLKNELQITLNDIEQKDLVASSHFVNKWIFIKSENLVNKFNAEFQKFCEHRKERDEVLNKQLAFGVPGDQLIDQMIADCNCYICGRDFEKNSKEYEVIRSHKNKNKIKDYTPEMVDLAVEFGYLNASLSNKDLTEEYLWNDFMNFRTELTETESRRDIILTRLSHANDDLKQTLDERGVSESTAINTSNYFQRYRETQKKRVELESQARYKKSSHQAFLSELTRANSRRAGFAATPEGKAIPEEFLHEISVALKNCLEQLVKDERERILQEIEMAANMMISDIIDASKEINNIITVKVKINLVTCRVQFIDWNGNQTFPHGAQEELAKLSVISAVLSITSKYLDKDYTFIVDAPASKFDSTIFKPYFDTTAKNYKQSIVILKDIHSDLEEYRNYESIRNLIVLNKNITGSEGASMTNSYTEIRHLNS